MISCVDIEFRGRSIRVIVKITAAKQVLRHLRRYSSVTLGF